MWPIIVLSILCFNQVMTLPTTSASLGDEEDTHTMGSEVSSPLHVAQCRATCLQQVNPGSDTNLHFLFLFKSQLLIEFVRVTKRNFLLSI